MMKKQNLQKKKKSTDLEKIVVFIIRHTSKKIKIKIDNEVNVFLRWNFDIDFFFFFKRNDEIYNLTFL